LPCRSALAPRGRSIVGDPHVHRVFVATYRCGVFDDAMLTRCEQVIRPIRDDFAVPTGGAQPSIVKEHNHGQKHPDRHRADASSRP